MRREQAEKLLRETGLLEKLSAYGRVFVTGSCRMDMMCWNDLDLYIEDSENLRKNWFSLTGDVLEVLRPYRFDGFCKGDKLFFGCETDVTGEKWNVDIWVRSAEQIKAAEEYCDDIVRRTAQQPGLREAIIAIKGALIEKKMYGLEKMAAHHYHSDEIYRAVLDEGVRTVEELLEKHPV